MKVMCKEFVCLYKLDALDREECCCTCEDKEGCAIVCSLLDDNLGLGNCKYVEFKKEEKGEGEKNG